MPTIKRAGVKAQEVKTGFEAYDGPEPSKRGMYRSTVTAVKYKRFRKNDKNIQNEGLVVTVTLEAAKNDIKDHKQFDGYTLTTNLVFGDAESLIARESNFYAALGVKDSPDIVTEPKGDIEQGIKVTKIGGKNPVGSPVNADIKMGTYEGSPRPEIDGLYVVKGESAGTRRAPAKSAEPDEDEDLLEESDDEDEPDEEAEGDDEYAERERELNALDIPGLKAVAKEDGLAVGGTKAALVARILEAEFEAVDEDAEEEEDDEPDDEDESDEYDEEARREELADLDRTELKKIVKALDPEFKVFQKTTDDEIRDGIIALESETPF